MNELLEMEPQTEPETFRPKAEALELIKGSGIPTELKQHFSDIIQILGHETEVRDGNRAKQIMNIADELNMAKRHYLDTNELEDDPGMNELVRNIVHIYSEV